MKLFEREDQWGTTWYWTNKDDEDAQFYCADGLEPIYATQLALTWGSFTLV